jgi:hypothetical protein
MARLQLPAKSVRLRAGDHRASLEQAPASSPGACGRTYAEGKKISWRDGVAAFWHIVRFNLLPPVIRDTVREVL